MTDARAIPINDAAMVARLEAHASTCRMLASGSQLRGDRAIARRLTLRAISCERVADYLRMGEV